jgi:hypothetical protein
LDAHLLAIDEQANRLLAQYYMYSIGDELKWIC